MWERERERERDETRKCQVPYSFLHRSKCGKRVEGQLWAIATGWSDSETCSFVVEVEVAFGVEWSWSWSWILFNSGIFPKRKEEDGPLIPCLWSFALRSFGFKIKRLKRCTNNTINPPTTTDRMIFAIRIGFASMYALVLLLLLSPYDFLYSTVEKDEDFFGFFNLQHI